MESDEAHIATESLVRMAAEGNHQAFEALMRRYAPLVAARAHRFAIFSDQVEDLMQEIMVKAYCQLGNLRRADRFGAWLSVLATNTAHDHYRVQARRARPASDEMGQITEHRAGPREQAELSEAERAVLDAINRLGRRFRDVVYLSLIEGLSSPEIGALLELKESTVRMRLAKGTKTVRSHLIRMGYALTSNT